MGKLARRITDGRTTGVRIRSVVFDDANRSYFIFPTTTAWPTAAQLLFFFTSGPICEQFIQDAECCLVHQ
ncbi:hypothetical protein [Delftia tsuruhatensis]|uniref:hypothetical protein n=1 Tax=Delftia tsuruhatensis TaxID=180282 RepID=UPI00209076AD|nr:hypothetical protein [Delftia tsuruhatensis]MCO5340172.1 hypothetical protein [Delftia tsuruhatensis]MCR4543243.1 hypothetical protein [Delftia tsuruhatensis]